MKPLAVAAYKAEHIFFYDIIFDKRIKTAVLIHLVKIEIAQAYYRAVVAFNLFTVATHIFSVIGAQRVTEFAAMLYLKKNRQVKILLCLTLTLTISATRRA